MYALKYSNRFKKDLKRFRNNQKVISELETLLDYLVQGRNSPAGYRAHRLLGEFKACYECHLEPDVLLIYAIDDTDILILLIRIGSHAELFG